VTTYLLDANVLIALTVVEHEHHARASAWVTRVDRFALCPVVEGALVRFLVRVGESVSAATQLLEAVHAMPRCEFWPDRLSYVDAYLVRLAADREDAKLATLDEGLRQERPDVTLLVPPA
jgi:predicted nucleic acid-binding protein